MMMMMMMMMIIWTSKGTVLIYFMVIKRELAEVILINICFRILLISLLILLLPLKEIYLVFSYEKSRQNLKSTLLLTPMIPDLQHFSVKQMFSPKFWSMRK